MNNLKKGNYYNNKLIYRLIAMKVIIMVTSVLCLTIQASVFSQVINIKTEMNNTSIKEVLTAIEKVSDIRFFYNDGFTGLDQKVDVSLNNHTLDQILSPMLKTANMTYYQMDKNFGHVLNRLIVYLRRISE